MTKRRVFLAYCSKKQKIAAALQESLQHDYEVVHWQDADWSGGVLLDNIIDTIQSCQYGIAMLSCDDEIRTGSDTYWTPRDNVTMELGFFLSHFGKARTAIVSITEPNGELPKLPTDLDGWLYLETRDSLTSAVVEKIRKRFESKDANIIPSLAPQSASGRGFNVLTMADARDCWGKFEGKFFSLNPSWTMEQIDSEWLKLHFERYQNPNFTEAHYIVDIDRGRNISATQDPGVGQTRNIDVNRDLLGISRFIKQLRRKYPGVNHNLEEKMKVYVCPGVKSEMTTFVSEYQNQERAFIFVPCLNQKTVLEARFPEHVQRLREHVGIFMAGREYFKPSEVELLCSRIIVH